MRRVRFKDATGKTLIFLTNNTALPAPLLKAHRAPGAAVDAAYALNGGKKSCKSDAERLAFLFSRYAALTIIDAAT